MTDTSGRWPTSWRVAIGTPHPAWGPASAGRVDAGARAKRAIDVVFAVLGILVVAVPLLVLTVWVWLQDGGSPWFAQDRVGQNGRRFRMWKLRSMRVGAAALQPLLQAHNEADGPLFKMRADPRITPLGRWLRRTSLDELPQLLNVVRGEMSLVGPRPALPKEVEQYTLRERRRLDVRPGLTGLWQVSGRSTLTFEQGMALDLHYVAHRSWVLDLRVLLLTLPAVIRGTGAW